MAKFDTHFKMQVDDVGEYILTRVGFFSKDEELEVTEIGDGNINYIYRIRSLTSGKSVILKHADIETRVRPDGYLGLERTFRECEVLKLHGKEASEFVPKVFDYDPIMATITMEDIGSHIKLRDMFMEFKTIDGIGDSLAGFLVRAELSYTGLLSFDKKDLSAKFVNKDMCKISEDLVFTHPYKDVRGRNILTVENKDWLENHFYKNKKLQQASAELRFKFENYNETLIHGDLHSGSIFVNTNANLSVKIIDPEFAFYGPLAYDLGNIIAHFVFAKKYAEYYAGDNLDLKKRRESFIKWITCEIDNLIILFKEKGINFLSRNTIDPLFKDIDFIKYYINTIIKDAYRFAGAELNRRVIGSAKVDELMLTSDINARIQMEQDIVLLGSALMTEDEEVSL